jgi:tetratricopeptide (TPR) repeat protein
VGKARVALAQGDAKGGQRAAQLLEKAYKQSPLVETAWLLGDARTLAGDAAGAKEAYALVDKQGRRTDPRTLALMLATQNREPELALKLAEEERKIRGDIYTLDACAFAAYRAGKLPEARAAADQAIRLGTRDARLWFHAGAIHLATGDAVGGKKLLRDALQLNPKFDLLGAAEAARLGQ